MKKFLALPLLALIFLCLHSFAGTTLLVGSLSTVNGTTNSPSATAGSVTFPVGQFIVANGGLVSTNEMLVNEEISFDNTNFLTINTFSFSTTNANTVLFPAGTGGSRTVYTRLRIVTTNSVGVGGSYVQ